MTHFGFNCPCSISLLYMYTYILYISIYVYTHKLKDIYSITMERDLPQASLHSFLLNNRPQCCFCSLNSSVTLSGVPPPPSSQLSLFLSLTLAPIKTTARPKTRDPHVRGTQQKPTSASKRSRLRGQEVGDSRLRLASQGQLTDINVYSLKWDASTLPNARARLLSSLSVQHMAVNN